MKTQTISQRTRRASGFTLIELLVSMSVLALVLVLFAKVTGSVSDLYHGGKAKTESNTLGRAVLDAIASDLSHAVIRPDLGVADEKSPGNVSLKFYCLKTGSFDSPGTSLDAARGVSVVKYVLYNLGGDRKYLARLNLPVTWESSRQSIPMGHPGQMPEVTAETYVSDGVLGLDFAYIRANGEIDSKIKSSGADAPPVVAIRVSLAVMDKDSVAIARSTGQLDTLKQLFPTATGDTPVIKTWNDNLNARAGSLPPRLIQGIRFYERTVPLSTVASRF